MNKKISLAFIFAVLASPASAFLVQLNLSLDVNNDGNAILTFQRFDDLSGTNLTTQGYAIIFDREIKPGLLADFKKSFENTTRKTLSNLNAKAENYTNGIVLTTITAKIQGFAIKEKTNWRVWLPNPGQATTESNMVFILPKNSTVLSVSPWLHERTASYIRFNPIPLEEIEINYTLSTNQAETAENTGSQDNSVFLIAGAAVVLIVLSLFYFKFLRK